MNNEDLLKRITINPKVMVGKPVIKGTRLTVEYLQEYVRVHQEGHRHSKARC